MSFKMIYDSRNRTNLDKLADYTKIAAYKWYQYCIDNKIQVLIYETIRSKEKQAENVRKGKSQTMNSWHLTGQALDWVLIDVKNGSALWNAYKTKTGLKVIEYAESLGFTSGHRWGWDSPHLQYEYKGYGTDTYGKIKGNGGLTVQQYNELKQMIEQLQKELDSKLDAPVKRDASTSHMDAWEWLKTQAITDGSNPQAFLTREQFGTMLSRYHAKYVKKLSLEIGG